MNWRLDIKKKFANFMVTALGAELGKFDSWNSQQTNHADEETKPNLVIYFEYSEIGEGFAYLLQTEMQAVKRIPVQVTLHIVFNQYSGLNQDTAYDYADKLTRSIVGAKDELISGKILKVSEVEDLNHKANYDYQIAFGFWIKEEVFQDPAPVDSNPIDAGGNPDTGRKLLVPVTISIDQRGEWILRNGVWDDSGYWEDTAEWKDN